MRKKIKMWWEIPGHLEIKNGKFCIGNKSTLKLARKYGTPLYVYNFGRVVSNIERLREAFKQAELKAKIFYAAKANSSLALLKFLKNKVEGVDAASIFEVKLALEAGFNSNEIMVTTPALTNEELKYLLKKRIKINADSFSQIDKIEKIKNNLGLRNISLGIRINPLIEIGAHEHIRTGGKYSKFGVLPSQAVQVIKRVKDKGLKIDGLHCHAGSNWLAKDLMTFKKITEILTNVGKRAKKFTKLTYLDFGGGLGIPQSPGQIPFSFKDLVHYAWMIKRTQEETEAIEARIEPGRFLIGDAGILLTKIIHISRGEKPINVAIVDAGFNIFTRPFTYGAYHQIVNCSKVNKPKIKKYMIGGNLCEGGDVFNISKKELRAMSSLEENDILAILNTGAYGFAMSSQFNSRPRAAEVAILSDKDKLIRKRENYQDLRRNQFNF